MDKYSTNTYFQNLEKYFRLANYLSCAQLYLLDNPLLERPLKTEDIKKKIVGHWGTVPGQNFVYAHCNRVINKYNQDMILISGPGHGGNFFVANTFIEGTYTEYYPQINQTREGLKRLFKQFSFAGGIPSHVAPETPGSMHEGGELGYSLSHGFGAVLDNKDLIATVIVGDGEAETGPLATAWHGNKFLNPVTDGAVLPILHLNGYKINNPTVLSRISKTELVKYLEGCGYKPYFVEDNNNTEMQMHKKMAKAMDKCVSEIQRIWKHARQTGDTTRPIYPMIVLRTKKGWTGPKKVDNNIIENSYRAHQVPIPMTKPEHIKLLEDWLNSYKPEELFDNYKIKKEIVDICPKGDKRVGANKTTNGGELLKDLVLPNIKDYEVKFDGHGTVKAQDMLELSGYLRDVIKNNPQNFRIFGPDEAMSNRLYKIFEADKKQFNAKILPTDDLISGSGRIMDSYLSEHMCEGMLEGYILTGRHGIFDSYEAFARVVDSMVSQHAKWLKVCNQISWRKPISSLNLLLSSNVWQQDHNGYTHLDPGMLDHIANKKADVARIYLPYDANSLISTMDHCLKSKNYVNVVVASKHPSFQWLNMEDTIKHCTKGISKWEFASTDNGEEPDVVIACAGDTPTLEALAAVQILHSYYKDLKIRFINVIDIFKLQSNTKHPHGLTDEEFDKLFTLNKPVVFCFHGHAKLIHELVYCRKNRNFHVKGYIEEGTITTSFDMKVQNKIDRYHLVLCALNHLDVKDKEKVIKEINDKLDAHKKFIVEYGIDMPEIANFEWKDLN